MPVQALLRQRQGSGPGRPHVASRDLDIGRRHRVGWISYDPALNLIYYGTANPGPWNADQRPGDNKWTGGIFARDPDSGKARWFYQAVPHDLFDYDAINELLLLDLDVGSVEKGSRAPRAQRLCLYHRSRHRPGTVRGNVSESQPGCSPADRASPTGAWPRTKHRPSHANNRRKQYVRSSHPRAMRLRVTSPLAPGHNRKVPHRAATRPLDSVEQNPARFNVGHDAFPRPLLQSAPGE
jgi:hypothetical protein